jgi:hypothetical protein
MRRRNEIMLMCGIVLGLTVGAGFAGAQAVADKDFVYNDHGRRDPFGKLVSSSGVILTPENDLTAADLSLEGILADGSGKNIVIINSRVLKENDLLGAFRVVKITADAVILQREGQAEITLKLKKED